MAKPTYPTDLKPGDLIKAYEKGYHLFIRYEERGRCPILKTQQAPLVYYQRVVSEAGNPVKSSKILCCDAAWCSKVTPEIIDQLRDDAIAQANAQWANLQKYAHK